MFGWTTSSDRDTDYLTFYYDGYPVAGVAPQPEGSTFGDVWTVYVEVEDIDQATGRATDHGGSVAVRPTRVGDQGSMAVIRDPVGAVLGLWEPRLHRGFGVVDEPGAPTWFETVTPDHAATLSFYAETFAWTFRSISDVAEPRYSIARVGSVEVAGVLQAQAGDPRPRWQYMVGSEDTDAISDRVLEMEGSVHDDPSDSSFGRVVTVVDPMGARLRLTELIPVEG